MKEFNQNCLTEIAAACEDWHPMKGPMTTQILQDIIGHEPLHWRADRDGIEEFNPAFIGLQGDDDNLTDDEMQEYEDFLATIRFPPNPFRNFDNSLPDNLPLPGHFTTGRFGPPGRPLPEGNANRGLDRYRTGGLDGIECVTCHTLPSGTGPDMGLVSLLPPTLGDIPVGPNGERHSAVVSIDGSTNVSIKIPQLRNLYEKVGFEATQISNRAGFGFLHDGSVDSIARFVAEPVFDLVSDQDVADMVAFMLAFSGSDLPEGGLSNILEPPGLPSGDTHAAVGAQLTVDGANREDPEIVARLSEILALADQQRVGVVAKGVQQGVSRGYAYVGSDSFQSDRQTQDVAADTLRLAADDGAEVTFTVVPKGSEARIGIDRDEDGFFDRDELDACSDPADPLVTPLVATCDNPFSRGECNSDGLVDVSDAVFLLSNLFQGGLRPTCEDACDGNDDGFVDLADAVYQFGFLFTGGPVPDAPFRVCGDDPTDDALGCSSSDCS